MTHPNRETCMQYLSEYETPKHVIGHCKSVAAVAMKLGEALNACGGTKAAPISEVTVQLCTRDDDIGRNYYRQKAGENEDYPSRLFDLDLVQAAGLLHDMARVEENHWDVAADFCEERGYIEEAKAIRVHMMYEFTNDADHLTEIDLICLGDRLTLEDRYAGIDIRMDYIVKKAERNGHPEAKPRILAKKEETRVLLHDIERRIGSIDSLMENLIYD